MQQHGLKKTVRKGVSLMWRQIRHRYYQWRFRDAPHFANPTPDELITIERSLRDLGICIYDYVPSTDRFHQFQLGNWFPSHYHGGCKSGVWEEKILEHWIAGEILGLAEFAPEDVYVDVAAGNSPWAKTLRERSGLNSFAIDLLPVDIAYRDLPYYRTENATKSSFGDCAVRGVSLQCAFEMFMGDDDTLLIDEIARILKPGGKAVILPLYMHTHYCAYAAPEYFGKGYAPPGAKEYVRMDCFGVPSSRKYDALTLQCRVIVPIQNAGLKYRVLALRNKSLLGKNIYCHFILEIEK